MKKNAKKRRTPFLRTVFLFAFLAASAAAFAQPEDPAAAGAVSSVPGDGAAAAGTEENRDSADGGAAVYDERAIRIDALPSAGEEPPDSVSTSGTAGALFRLVLVLVLLCAACWLIFRFLRKSAPVSAADPFLKNVASLPVETGKSVAVITLGTRAFLIGVADHSVSLLAEITDPELIDRMNLHAGLAAEKRKSFLEVLSAVVPKIRPETGSRSSSASGTAEFIRKSRSRLAKNPPPDTPEPEKREGREEP